MTVLGDASMEDRHPDDVLAERYATASPEEQQRIADQIAKLPAPKAPRIAIWVISSISLAMVGYFNWLSIVELAHLKPNLWGLALLDVYVLARIAKAIMVYRVSKPSVYNMLAEYKTRHGHLPPK